MPVLTWLGQSGFLVESAGRRLLIDPFFSEHEDRMYPPPPIALAWRIPRAQIDAGSPRTASAPSPSGTATRCSGDSGTSSAAKPCSLVIPRSR